MNEKGPALGAEPFMRGQLRSAQHLWGTEAVTVASALKRGIEASGVLGDVADELRKLQCLLVLKMRNASARSCFSIVQINNHAPGKVRPCRTETQGNAELARP